MWQVSILHLAHVFLYVGPDVDAFSLNLLRPSETKVVLVEPLVAWRNRYRTQQKMDSNNADRLFECETQVKHVDKRFAECVRPLTMQDVDEYVEAFRGVLLAASRCPGPENNGLKNLRIMSANASIDRLSMTFVSAGIFRTIKVLFRRVQDVNWADDHGHAISTLNFLGVGPNAPDAVALFCRSRRHPRQLRIVTGDGNLAWATDGFGKVKNPSCCTPHSNCDSNTLSLAGLHRSFSWIVDSSRLCNESNTLLGITKT